MQVSKDELCRLLKEAFFAGSNHRDRMEEDGCLHTETPLEACEKYVKQIIEKLMS